MIERILDKYYTQKLKEYLHSKLQEWYIDYRIIEDEGFLMLQIKLKKYNDRQYIEILKFDREIAIYYLCNQPKLDRFIRDGLNAYIKEEVKNE